MLARLGRLARSHVRWMLYALVITSVMWAAVHLGVTWFARSYRIVIHIQQENCLPWSVLLARRVVPSEIHRGDLVTYVAHHMGHGFDGMQVGKLVVGLPGDHIQVARDELSVNGVYWDRLWLMDRLNAPAHSYDREEIVPDGSLFVLGTYYRSYDSRYWGLLHASEITGTAVPLW